MHRERTHPPEVSSGSMADIAFLLLTFFLLTTTIADDKGILMLLPEYNSKPRIAEVNDRNMFTIQINSYDRLLVEGVERGSAADLRNDILKFILNPGKELTLSESPEKAIISIRTDRGTSHLAFVAALDEAQAAYFEIYADRSGISPKAFRNLDTSDPAQKELYDKGRAGIPMNISIAEPTSLH